VANKEERGRQASVDGFAHEHIVVGILMKKYKNVSLVDLPLSPYDIILVLKNEENQEEIIRAQVKTAKNNVNFIGGSRGGVDRIYKSDVKTYRQSPKTSDVVIGLHLSGIDAFELYFIPSVLIEELDQKSISLNKISPLRNNYEMLERCKDKDFILEKAREWGIL